MSERYYIADTATLLDMDETRARLVQRLRQYREVRNLAVLIGNGSSMPLGAQLVGNTSAIVSELDRPPHM